MFLIPDGKALLGGDSFVQVVWNGSMVNWIRRKIHERTILTTFQRSQEKTNPWKDTETQFAKRISHSPEQKE